MFARLKSYLATILQDVNGYPSSKRWLVLIVVTIIVVSWIANLVWRIVVDSNILEAVKWLGGGGVASIAAEYLGKQKDGDSNG